MGGGRARDGGANGTSVEASSDTTLWVHGTGRYVTKPCATCGMARRRRSLMQKPPGETKELIVGFGLRGNQVLRLSAPGQITFVNWLRQV